MKRIYTILFYIFFLTMCLSEVIAGNSLIIQEKKDSYSLQDAITYEIDYEDKYSISYVLDKKIETFANKGSNYSFIYITF